MATPINKPFKRQIHLYGVDRPVIITLHQHCLEMAVVGSSKKMMTTWNNVAEVLTVPANAPSIYHGRSFKFLQHISKISVEKAAKRKAKRGSA